MPCPTALVTFSSEPYNCSRFVTKLPKERVDELVRSGTGAYFDPGHGRLMKEWIALEGTEKLWLDLAKEARRFVSRTK